MTRWWFQIFFIFTLIFLGNDPFQIGWFNHQLDDHFCSFSFQDADIEVIHSQEPGLWSKTTRNTSAHGVEYRLQLGVTAAASALLRITGANRGVSHFVFE